MRGGESLLDAESGDSGQRVRVGKGAGSRVTGTGDWFGRRMKDREGCIRSWAFWVDDSASH